ncbi:MAG: glycosyltransferase family 25 protein [Simkaniaceae bacterium]|nr:glycosyltransferase family 25 protein [Simkaniaceae bacterium]
MIRVWLLIFPALILANPYSKLLRKIEEPPQSSIEGIDSIRVINLDSRPELWHRLEPLLNYHNIKCQRFSAISGWEFPWEILQEALTRRLTGGPLGCLLSHLSILNDAISRNHNVIWTLEDDPEVRRDPKLLTRYIEDLTQFDPKWDVLYTDVDWTNRNGIPIKFLSLPIEKKTPLKPLSFYTKRTVVCNNIARIHGRYGTVSMIFSKRGMRKIVRHFLNSDDIVWPYDIEIHLIPGIRQYGLINPVVTNGHFDFNYSDCGKNPLENFYKINSEHYNKRRLALKSIKQKKEKWKNYFDRLDF